MPLYPLSNGVPGRLMAISCWTGILLLPVKSQVHFHLRRNAKGESLLPGRGSMRPSAQSRVAHINDCFC